MTLALTKPGPVQHALRAVGDDCESDLATIAELHMELLGFGPMAGLGEPFIREICYAVHVRDGLLRVALYEVDGVAAGFVAYTSQSIGFHRKSLRGHWAYASWLVLLSVLQNPPVLWRLVRAIRVVTSRRAEQERMRDPLGEVVCVAVRPQYLKARFARETGLRPSEELIAYAARCLRDEGVGQMRMVVDSGNKAVLLLYHKLGARFEPYEQGGEPKVQVWFDLGRFSNEPVVERS